MQHSEQYRVLYSSVNASLSNVQFCCQGLKEIILYITLVVVDLPTPHLFPSQAVAELLEVLNSKGSLAVPPPSWHYEDAAVDSNTKVMPLGQALLKAYDLRWALGLKESQVVTIRECSRLHLHARFPALTSIIVPFRQGSRSNVQEHEPFEPLPLETHRTRCSLQESSSASHPPPQLFIYKTTHS